MSNSRSPNLAALSKNMLRSQCMDIAGYCRKTIIYTFYALFFLVPLVFWGSTSELFELNKILVLYLSSLIIITAWGIETIIEKQIKIRKTFFDIPILLFLTSQLVSTFISLDPHVSFWGYYSRFNGGFLSLITYFLLYYAFVTHFTKEQIFTLLKWLLLSGFLVTLWGLPSHFGKDPTCYIFRGELSVTCWTDAFKPTIRIFSTLGQPAWLAAFLAALLPLSVTMFLRSFHKAKYPAAYYLLLTALFYLCLVYTNTRAGFIGFWIANIFYWFVLSLGKSKKTLLFLTYFLGNMLLLIFSVFRSNDLLFWFVGILGFLIVLGMYGSRYRYQFVVIHAIFLLITFFAGSPLEGVYKYFSFSGITQHLSSQKSVPTNSPQTQTQTQSPPDVNITDSGNIRQIVWKGAFDVWKANPVIGTGVETFAFAYYQHRPVEHNYTSEWDYLYNKAHNEYLNYLATTGSIGLGTYILFIGYFMFYVFKKILQGHIITLSQDTNKTIKRFSEEDIYSDAEKIMTLAFFTGWVTILITNFFGFSVVIMNLFLFLFPVIVYTLREKEKSYYSYPAIYEKTNTNKTVMHYTSGNQWLVITLLLLFSAFMLFMLFRFWQADQKYGLGYNLNRAGDYQNAYLLLREATDIWPSEPVFQDELSLAAAQLGFAYYDQQQANSAARYIQEAVDINSRTLAEHPKYLPFWKTRVRMFYTLSQLSPNYQASALDAAQQAAALAPTDARIWYNLGVMYGQTGNTDKAIEVLEKTLVLKPDYQDVYYALALMYRDQAVKGGSIVVDFEIQKQAETTVEKLLQLNPKHEEAKKLLQEWKK